MRKYLNQDPRSLQQMWSMDRDGAARTLGVRLSAVGPDFIMAEMPVDERTTQPFGLLHGGASVLLAETLGSYGSALLISDEADTRVVGVEVGGTHVRGASQGWVTGIARPIRIGRSMHFWGIDVLDEAGKLVCSARLTVSVLRRGTAASPGKE